MAQRTPIEFYDTVLPDQLTEYAKEYVSFILDALAPDGRPFGAEKQSKEKQFQQYLLMRDDPYAWDEWMREKVDMLTRKVGTLPPNVMAKISPWTVAQKLAYAYAAQMERYLLTKVVEEPSV